ncbi:MAG: hypothetical protein J6D37_00640 [Clostridia bacterium]|nr:hypothetical protein [Clostridia bacterium]
MKIVSVALLLLYSALMFLTLFVKDDKMRRTKPIAAVGIAFALAHTILFFFAETHLAILLSSLLLFMAYAIANGVLTKKPHILHWIVRFLLSVGIFVLFVI